MLTSSSVHLIGNDVIDPDINYSDHLPILCNFDFVLSTNEPAHKSVSKSPLQLCWDHADHADLLFYYNSAEFIRNQFYIVL
jgi:hypothetical protein